MENLVTLDGPRVRKPGSLRSGLRSMVRRFFVNQGGDHDAASGRCNARRCVNLARIHKLKGEKIGALWGKKRGTICI